MTKKLVAFIMALIMAVSSFSLFAFAAYEPDYIYDQEDASVADIPWGMLGNTADNGCGWVATYNIMATYDGDTTKESVISGLTIKQAPFFFGLLGAKPFGIRQYLADYFEETKIYFFSASKWEDYAKDCDGVIVLYASLKSGIFHYVAGVADEEGKFRFYNTNYASYASPISVGDYVSIITKNDRLPIAFITVKGVCA